jgi:hypothetical protein
MGRDEVDLAKMAESVGFPTFDEYCKNPEKYLGRDDAALAEVENGSTQLNRTVQRHIYEIEGYKCRNLEEVERIATSMGIKLKELDYRPQVQTNTSGGVDIKVTFVSKELREKRKDW